MQENIEIWKDVVGYEGKYQVSSFGNVRSMSYNRKGIIKELLKKDNGRGYLYVCFIKNGKHKWEYIHRLVASSFINKNIEKMEINHIDFNRYNNNLSNLEITTRQQNYDHSRERMSSFKSRKPVGMFLNGVLIKKYNSISETKKDGYNIGKVCQCCRGSRKTHHNFIWKYL